MRDLSFTLHRGESSGPESGWHKVSKARCEEGLKSVSRVSSLHQVTSILSVFMMGAQEGPGHRRPEASILFLRNHALTFTHTTHSCVASAAGNFAKSNQRMREDTASILTSALRPPHEAELSFKIESVFFRRFSLHSVFFVQKSLFIPQSSC